MRLRFCGFLAAALFLAAAGRAVATPGIVIDVATGNVFYENDATQPWYPASLTKLMTVYVALSAVRDHKISLDTPLVVSRYAASMPPSKMGFRPGTEVTLGNALKMLMVKSPNDLAVTIAEGIAGTVPAFADMMNDAAARLGMRQSHFVNPNGLQNREHYNYTSARDLAVLARAIYHTFPQYAGLFDIGAIRVGKQIIPNHNNMLGRYPGVDGMKTGFTCDAGFNLVASATRDGHHYVAVVLGAPNVKTRLVRTAVLLDRAFDGVDRPQPMAAYEPTGGMPEDMRSIACSRRRAAAVVAYDAETDRLEAPLLTLGQRSSSPFGALSATALAAETPASLRIALTPEPIFDPVTVLVGPEPGYAGPIAGPRPPDTPVGTPLNPGVVPIAQADDASAGTSSMASAGRDAGKAVGDAEVRPEKARRRTARTRSHHRKAVAKAAHRTHRAAKAKKSTTSHRAHHTTKRKSATLKKSAADKNKSAARRHKSGTAEKTASRRTHPRHRSTKN